MTLKGKLPASVLNSCGHTDLAVVSIELDVCSKINIFSFNSFCISKPSLFYKIEIANDAPALRFLEDLVKDLRILTISL